jgi:hypothetical protein
MEPYLFIGAIALFVGGMVYIGNVQQKRRTQAMGAFAGQMGWEFEENPPLLPELTAAEPFSSGRSHRMRNRLTRRHADETVSAFDFFYTTGGGKNAQHHRLTVVRLPLTAGTPPFSVSAEHFFHRIAGVFGMQDIDFPEYPTFSKRYLLRGPDEAAVRRAFRPQVVEFFESVEGIFATSNGRDLFLWAAGLAPPTEIEGRLEMAFELRRRLVA